MFVRQRLLLANERAWITRSPSLLTNSCCCCRRVRFWFCDGTQICLVIGILHRKFVRNSDSSTFRIQKIKIELCMNQADPTTLSFFCSLSCIIDLPRGGSNVEAYIVWRCMYLFKIYDMLQSTRQQKSLLHKRRRTSVNVCLIWSNESLYICTVRR